MKNVVVLAALAAVVAGGAQAQNSVEPFLGNWALTIPGGGAGWLNVRQESGYLDGDILWGGGSVVPVSSVFVEGDTLFVTRTDTVKRKNEKGEIVREQAFTKAIVAHVSGDTLDLVVHEPNESGLGVRHNNFTGKRISPVPGAPDLSNVKLGDPVELFNGKNLDGWRLTNPGSKNGWRAEDGVLVNEPVQPEGKPHVSYGNLRTDAEFEDFNLKLEVMVEPKGNSGIYLRGIYEVQVMDSFGMDLDPHHMGGIYSRITPAVAAEKPAGEWQTCDITLLDRHVTVTLNGKTIINNQPLLGCTGGALRSDEFKPGPIYLQGDHTGVKYRNVVLTPILK